MTYATTTDLLTRFDATEIAQRVDRGVPRLVNAALLTDAAAANSLAAYTSAETERVAQCLVVIERALADADDTINGYLSGRYAMPLSTVPSVLSRVACEMARFYLYDDQVTDLVKDRHASNLKWLAEVAKGTVSLGVDAASGAQPLSGSAAEIVSNTPVWKRSQSGGFI